MNGPKPPQDPHSPYRRDYDRLEPYRERMISTAKPPEQFVTVLVGTLEAKNPPILRPVGADARAPYTMQRLLPSRLMPALFRLAFRADNGRVGDCRWADMGLPRRGCVWKTSARGPSR